MTYLETNVSFILMRCDEVLRQKGYEDSVAEYPQLLDAVSRGDKDAIDNWAQQERQLSDHQAVRYFALLDMLGKSNVMRSLLDLSLAAFFYSNLNDYIQKYFKCGVCLGLAYAIEGVPFPSEKEVLEYALPLRVFFNLDSTASPIMYQQLKLDDRLVSFLEGSDEMTGLLSMYCELFDKDTDLHEPFINLDILKEGSEFFDKGGKVVQLSRQGGRRFLAKHIAKSIARDFLFISLKDLTGSGRELFLRLRSELVREAMLQNAGICIYGITDELTNDNDENILEAFERDVADVIVDYEVPLIICCDTSAALIKKRRRKDALILELPERLSYDERKLLWAGFSKLYDIDVDPNEAAMRYHLNASETMSVIRGLESIKERDGEDRNMFLSRLALSAGGMEKNLKLGRIIYPRTRLKDVKLNVDIKEVIENVIKSVRIGNKVFDEWGQKENYIYGSAMSLLLSGPPGTGKTMTANAIAGELAIPLYQINLSNVVDKYIGETEKNLEKVFSFAEKANVVLFFDEADSIFGKRSEVKDSKDKYANNEISYLLQRIESYSGIVIMATNIKGNIDPAFMRRIRYVAHFDNPDTEMRKEIWESLINDRIPHDEIDIDFLAEQFKDFTGSVIKTVFLNACSMAAAEGDRLTMRHLMKALKMELSKGSSVAFTFDLLGKYAYLI